MDEMIMQVELADGRYLIFVPVAWRIAKDKESIPRKKLLIKRDIEWLKKPTNP